MEFFEVVKSWRKTDHLKEKEAQRAAVALNTYWNVISTYITERNYQFENISKAESHILGMLSTMTDAMENFNDTQLLEKNYRILSNVAMVIGKVSKKEAKKIMSKHEKEIFQLVSSQLHAKHPGLANVATELLHFFMEKNVNFQNVGVVENMFALVDNEDNVSNAVVTIIASQTLQKPENLIDSIFTRIDSSKPTERKNAIKIISKLFEIIQNKESGKEKKSQIEKLTFVTFFLKFKVC